MVNEMFIKIKEKLLKVGKIERETKDLILSKGKYLNKAFLVNGAGEYLYPEKVMGRVKKKAVDDWWDIPKPVVTKEDILNAKIALGL